MAVVAGVVFFTIRALLALFPTLTAGFPIKKWSAAAALAAAAFYLLLSGAEVATQRSFFMTAVVLIAVLVDRRAVTFRTLSVAAMIVLVLAPEALVHPSFQSLVTKRQKPGSSEPPQALTLAQAERHEARLAMRWLAVGQGNESPARRHASGLGRWCSVTNGARTLEQPRHRSA